MITRYRFEYSNKRKPCPLCGKTNGNCRTGISGEYIRQFCMTFRHGEGADGQWEFCHTTKDGNWGIYRLRGHRWQSGFSGFRPKQVSEANEQHKALSRREKNQYFNWLLRKAPLNEDDKKFLIEKGLKPEEISSSIFGSITQGILITFPDVYGYKIAAQIRRRIINNEGNKYYWYTSNKISVKLEKEQIPIAVWRNKKSDTSTIYLCEGYLKSYIAYCQGLRQNQNYPWIGFGSASYLRNGFLEIKKTIDILKPNQIIFVPDAGCAINALVREAYEQFWQNLQITFPEKAIFVASWGHEFSKMNKDIDEIEDRNIIRLYNLKEYLRYFRNLEIYPREERLSFWEKKLKEYKYILDSSPTGTGKTYDAGRLPGPCLYISNDHRNPSTETLQAWRDTEGRHGGLYRDQHGYWRRVTKPEQPVLVSANCFQHEKHQKLRDYGYPSHRLCRACPLLQACESGRGEGYGYLYERKLSLMAEKIRIHPDSLPRIDKFDYKNRTIIIEEAGDLNMVASLAVHEKSIDRTIEIIKASQNIPLEDQEKLIYYLEKLKEKVKNQLGKRYGIFNDIPVPEISKQGQLSLWEFMASMSTEDGISEEEWQQASKTEKRQLVWIDKLLKTETSKIEYLIQEIENSIPPAILWLLEKHPSWIGNNGYIYVYRVKEEIRQIIREAKNVIFLDATADRQKIALIYGIPLEEIHHIAAEGNQQENLEIYQIKDLGKLCHQRGNNQMKRLERIITKYREMEPNTRVIDLLKFSQDACWWRDSRGRNEFSTCKQLLLVGTPNRSWNHMLCSFLALGGNPKQFPAFYHEQTRQDILQGIGRIRSECRPHEKLRIILISNFNLNLPKIRQISSKDICILAAPKEEQKLAMIVKTYQELQQNQIKPTQTAIARQLNIRRETVNRCWQKVIELLKQTANPPIFTYQSLDEIQATEIKEGIIEVYQELKDQVDEYDLKRMILNMFAEIPQSEQEKWIKYILNSLYQSNLLGSIEKLLDTG